MHPRHRALADGHEAVFLALALADEQRAALPVEIVELQMDQFRAADAARVQHFQNRAVAQAKRIGDIRLQQHLLDLRDGEHMLGQAATQARQFDLRCRVVQDVILPRQPAKPTAQRHQARVLAAETQRLAVRACGSRNK